MPRPICYYIRVLKGKKDWYWRLDHPNGQVIATAEMYCSKYSALRTARALLRNMSCRVVLTIQGKKR